jgi:lysophospholipase L1-like esterase
MDKQYVENHLYGKTIVFEGDSICYGDGGHGWAYRVGEKNQMKWFNYGVCGGTVTAEMYANGNPRHWVSRSIDRIKDKHETLDYLIYEGGTNDADLLDIGSDKFGQFDPADYSGNYDDTTFTGALESLFYKSINYYPTAKIGFIVAQKMGRPKGCYGPDYKRRKFFLRAIEVCRKWGVPYLDLWESSIINPSLKCHYDPDLTPEQNRAAGKPVLDGQHLTSVGYDMISPAIEAWIRGL